MSAKILFFIVNYFEGASGSIFGYIEILISMVSSVILRIINNHMFFIDRLSFINDCVSISKESTKVFIVFLINSKLVDSLLKEERFITNSYGLTGLESVCIQILPIKVIIQIVVINMICFIIC
ncbi:hypothetical protein D1815_04995 [Aquimarina sp. AD1]|nr:hypothetical protein D1815_04995 [Aquimarina sp. AD1]